MGQISAKLRDSENNGLSYYCQGCKDVHAIRHGPGTWSWNGDKDRPVFSPSVLCRSGHFAEHWKPGDECWCTYNQKLIDKGEPPSRWKCTHCHTFVGCNGAQPGQVIFLPDCSHELAGQVLDLPDLPEWLQDPKTTV